jgi:hypothetical protein
MKVLMSSKQCEPLDEGINCVVVEDIIVGFTIIVLSP